MDLHMAPLNRSFFISVFLLCLLLSVTACQPAFIAQQAQYYAGQSGITNSFAVKRLRNIVLSPHSNLVVVSQATEIGNQASFSQTVANGLSPYFQSVVGGLSADSLESAKTSSKQHSRHYLIFVEVQNTDSLFTSSQDETGSGHFSEIHLLLTIIDLANGSFIDKITLSSDSSHFDVLGDDKDELLAGALRQIGRDLSGN